MHKRNLVIWGAGKFGKYAYEYYKDIYHIECYVDMNSTKWGQKLNGIEIRDPEEVRFDNHDVVVALKKDVDGVLKKLKLLDGVDKIIVFGIKEDLVLKSNISDALMPESFYISFSGGLGNQLFQYALLRCLQEHGKGVYANIDVFQEKGSRPFLLPYVFKKIHLSYVSSQDEKIVREKLGYDDRSRKYIEYIESTSIGIVKEAPKFLLDFDFGIVKGTHQTCYFAELCREELLNDLTFTNDYDDSLEQMKEQVSACNSVSIHVRRGDYVDDIHKDMYGGICTEDYYRHAIEYIIDNVESPRFYVFSDDIDYVKENYVIPNAAYITKDQFAKYEDWYDMFLMSQCKNNIIANSTFSWWGAWLNRNKSKVVIAPKKWINIFDYTDIYPERWITI